MEHLLSFEDLFEGLNDDKKIKKEISLAKREIESMESKLKSLPKPSAHRSVLLIKLKEKEELLKKLKNNLKK